MLLCLALLVMPIRATTIKTEYEEIPTLILIQENSLVALFSPNLPILDASQAIDEEYPTTDLMKKIIGCESSGDSTAENPKSGAYGLCQIIPSTEIYIETKWDMELDLKNPEIQLYACNRLYAEEHEKHWLASITCWDK